MSSMRLKRRLDTPDYRPPHPFKDAGVVADRLTGMHKALVKRLFVVNRNYIHKDILVFPQVKIQRIEI